MEVSLTAPPERVENGWFTSAGVTQLVECDLAKVDVAGSNPVSRSSLPKWMNHPITHLSGGYFDILNWLLRVANCNEGISNSMKRSMSLFVVLPVFSAALLAQQYKSDPAGAPPSGLAPAVASALDSNGTKISKADGTAVMEVWFRKTAPSGPKNSADSIALPTISVGTFLGVVKLESKGEDRRGQQLQPGIYTMRYVLMPSNGDHLGAAPQRDFAALVPAAEDKDPSTSPDLEGTVKMSTKASGTAHPAVLSLSSGSGSTTFTKEADHDWTLNTKIGDLPVAIILLGRVES
jgi:hypothetical protein